jgi:hypothetical protein
MTRAIGLLDIGAGRPAAATMQHQGGCGALARLLGNRLER